MAESVDAGIRELFRGQLWITYSQLLMLGSGMADVDLEAGFAGQRNGLLGAGRPGGLLLMTGLHTGWVPLVVESHPDEPAVAEGWEDIVEATFVPDPADGVDGYVLTGLMTDEHADLDLPAATYRVRYHVSGMDAAHQADTRDQDEPEVDRYLLQFWPAPAGPRADDAVLRQGSAMAEYWHRTARELPSQAVLQSRRAELSRRRAETEQREERRRLEEAQRQHELDRWGGRVPTGPILTLNYGPGIYRLDPDLAVELANLPAEHQRRVMIWLIDRGLARAGLAEIDWLAAEADALRRGAPPTEAFTEENRVNTTSRLFSDRRVPHTTVTTLDGATDNYSGQIGALMSMLIARMVPEPGEALFAVLSEVATTFGGHHYPVLLRELRAALPGPTRPG